MTKEELLAKLKEIDPQCSIESTNTGEEIEYCVAYFSFPYLDTNN